ncbi:hypothetical protein AVEN_105154-1 [Araneus ventricosus]|uniref:Uncharacterized protein n=1 Tax=Araneus ventricosus TaxID=182803 RepID=A0A4Y2K539_ARAVE|nr:hypothetical protein AVEN_105154-1 [Araneus ventricosus]
MEEGAERADHDAKENPVSTSPDSGVCDLDTNSEDQTKIPPPEAASSSAPRSQPYPEGRFRYTQNYDPFFFKYATDNRKLTLLKSLSQDSEYSLDTSLFDAEEFLQDMGFAGGSDPTIPDRFLPSLMQRLSKFPESEMESLHHRIVQSIGCFRRKEGKRRLFRNLSMGKGSSVDHFGKNHLPCPSNNYPLLRSNTGPAEFPFNEATTSAYEVNNNSLKSGRLSSSDSGHHSMDSLKNEGEFPESPIAILVSSASVEQEDKSIQEDTDKGVQVSMNEDEVLVDDVSSDSVPTPETVKQTSDGEFMNTVQEIQKLTDDISDGEDVASLSKDSDIATEGTQFGNQNASDDGEDPSAVSPNPVGGVDEISIEAKNQISLLHSDKSVSPENSAISSPVKRPLRRISNAQSYNPLRHSKGFGSLEHQNKINEDDDLDIEHSGVHGITPTFNESNDNSINNYNNNPFKNLEFDDASGLSRDNYGLLNETISNFKSSFSEIPSNNINSIPFSSNENSFTSLLSSNADSLPFYSNHIDLSESSSNRIATVDCKPEKETRSFTKPKFTRDDSLTNFLSSMLDTSESDSVLKPPVTPPNSLIENESKSDSEVLQDNFSSEKLSVQYSFNKAQSTEALSKTQCFLPLAQNLNYSEVKSIPDKSPNRKRRILRRMSSSLQCCDDDNCEDPDRLTVTEGFQFSPTNPFVSPKLPLRHTKSGHHDHGSGHRLVHPVSSLPPMKLYSPYKIQNEIGRCTNPFAYTTPDGVQSNSDPEATRVYYRKREKRNCKKRRYLSNADLYSNPWVRAGTRDFSKFNICGADMCNHQYLQDSDYGCSLETHRYYSCSCREANHSRMRFDERYPEWDHCFQEENMTSCTNCSSLNRHIFPSPHCQHSENTISPGLPMKGSFRHCMWNSTPDVRYGYCNSAFQDYRGRPKLNSLHDIPMDHCGNLSAASSFCDVAHLSDDVFFPEKVPYCCAHNSHQPDNVQSNSSRKLKVRMPQRQNSMSIDDADDHPFPTRKISTYRNNFQNSSLSKSGFLSGESSNTSSPPNGPSRKVSVVASPPNIPDDLQKNVQHKVMTPVSTREKQLNSFDSQFTNSVKNGPITNNKNEALLERKIRIFSKFFTNLGNLSKSIKDSHSDNEHKEKRDARFYDVIGTDKPRKSSVRCDFQAIPPRKCSTPPPEFDRLINLLKSPSSSLESSEECGTRHRTVRKVEYPVYENRVVLQAIPGVEGKQRHFKPVQFTSSLSMYINSDEDKEESNVHR